jgi:hypothetical protein
MKLTFSQDGGPLESIEMPDNITAKEANERFAAAGISIRALDPNDPVQQAERAAREKARAEYSGRMNELLGQIARVEGVCTDAQSDSLQAVKLAPRDWALLVDALRAYRATIEGDL